jgi:hypothetical protein
MTEDWTKAQRERWPLLVSRLDGTWTPPPNDAMPMEARTALDNALNDVVHAALPTQEEAFTRERIVANLTPVLERTVRGAKVMPFGSASTGLVLRHGDVDVCVATPSDRDQKRLVRDIARALRDENYVAIQPITRAKVPIVKCRDAVTKLPIDISVNNTLALRNTELIRAYVDLDPRVRDLVVLVKHWALHRGIADAFGGTLSSYAWTVLALRFLQSASPPLVPNLQEGTERRIESIDGRTYDTTIAQGESLSCDHSLGGLFAGFFHRWFVEHDWAGKVVSLREATEFTRKTHGWPSPKPGPIDVLQGRSDRTGDHVLPIEDPFDLEHDLSRVVRAEGWADIMEEGLRMWHGLVNGIPLVQLLQTVEHAPLDESPQGLFDDLRDRPRSEVERMLREARDAQTKTQGVLDALIKERERTIALAKAMRGTYQVTKGMSEEVLALVEALQARAMEMKLHQDHRDGIDEVAILPMNRILQELERLHRSLTTEVGIDNVPSLQHEQRDFARFLAVQAMHRSKPTSDASHAAYVELLRAQRDDVKRLGVLHLEAESGPDSRLEEVDLKAVRIRTGDVDEYDRRANRLSLLVRDHRRERKRLSREVGRLEAFLRNAQPQEGRGRRGNHEGHRPRRTRVDVAEVRQRAFDGGTISLEDLGALLDDGGLTGSIGTPPTRTRQRDTSSKKRHSQKRTEGTKQRRGNEARGKRGSR